MGSKRVVLAILWVFCAAGVMADRGTAVIDPAVGQYLYLDDRGAILLPGPYSQAESFSEALARVELTPGSTAYLRVDGSQAFSLPVPFSDTARFSGGLAAFVRQGLVGFVDLKGQEVLAPRFFRGTQLPVFEQGRAVVGLPPVYGWIKANGSFFEAPAPALKFSQGFSFLAVTGGYRLIDTEGRTVGTDTYEQAGPFSEGLAPVTLGGKTGWVDTTGKLVLPWDASALGPFVGGYAVFQKGTGQGLVDKKGKELLAADHYVELVPLHGSLDAIKVWKFREQASGPWGLVGEKGLLAKAQWDEVAPFSEGQAVVRLGTQSGFVTPKATLVGPLVDGVLGSLHEGVASFQKDGLFGFADPRGKVILEAKWTSVGEFSSGLAAVNTGGNWGLVDKKGKPVGPQTYQDLGPLNGKRRRFVQNGLTGYLDDKGTVVLGAVYEGGSDFHGTLAWVIKEHQGRLIGPDGKDAGPGGFVADPGDEAAPYRVTKPTQWGMIDPRGTWLLPPVYAEVQPGVGGPHLVVPLDTKKALFVDDKGAPGFALDGWTPLSPFREGRAFVQKDTGIAGAPPEVALVDPQGTLVARGFTGVKGTFVAGVACVRFERKWGYINPAGAPLFGLGWFDARPFSEGMAAVAFEDTWGYIGTDGTKIIPYQYGRASEFHNGLAEVTVGESGAFITKTGQRVWP